MLTEQKASGRFRHRRRVTQSWATGSSTIAITAALPSRCSHRLICTPGSASPTSSWLCPTMNGTTATSPTMPDTSAAVSHHEYCLNTAHAAIVNPATAMSARMLASVQAVPVGGGVLPAKAGVIHRKVVPNRNRPSARRFLKVHIAPPSGRDVPACAVLSPGLDPLENPSDHREVAELQQHQRRHRRARPFPRVPLLQPRDEARPITLQW